MKASETTAAKKLLIKARDSIAVGWTQGYSARDKEGNYVEAKSLAAVCWCARGAIAKHAESNEACLAAINRFELFIQDSHVMAWNDAPERTQAEVLMVFDKAIQSCND